MNPAQAARQEQGDEPRAANVDPQRGRGDLGPDRPDPDREPVAGEAEGELDELGFDDEEEDISRRAVELLSRVRRRIREQPLTAAAGAFILGFAFGNGVPKFMARAGIAVGLRLVMERLVDRADLFAEEA